MTPGHGVQETAGCTACGSRDLTEVLHWEQVPVHCCQLIDDEADAKAAPRGDMRLMFCGSCGFMFNAAFDPDRMDYSFQYEETQGFSPHFQDYSRSLAKRWIERHELHGRTVIEIGCGSGAEFLGHLLENGAGRGVGIDPGLDTRRVDQGLRRRLTLVPGYFPQDWPTLDADAVVCRHTLEHIASVRTFLTQVREAIGDRPNTAVLFELPDSLRVLHESAFWDVYYEHCSYFTAGSLGRLFRSCGFDVLGISLDYDDQYLLIEARPSVRSSRRAALPAEDDLVTLRAAIQAFTSGYRMVVSEWSNRLEAVAAHGGRIVIWGAGSKAVAFLAALGPRASLIEGAVDINPNKHDMFLPGTGHRVIAPDELRDRPPDLVVAMNPVYREEIAADLARRGIPTILEAL